MKPTVDTMHIATPCGTMVIGAYNDNLCMAQWNIPAKLIPTLRRLNNYFGTSCRESINDVLLSAKNQLDNYFALPGYIPAAKIITFGTPFENRVWDSLKDIPYGTVATYRQIAERIGMPGAVRAVASAIGRNPCSIFVPCHRVIGTDGSLTGYAGGLDAKAFLLKSENPQFFSH